MDPKAKEMAKGFLERAWNRLEEAKRQKERFNYAESISASQECIELSVKAAFLLLKGSYEPTHEFKEEEFENLLKVLPQEVAHWNFPRLYLLHKFWAQFYTIAKYGLEKLGVPANKLFKEAEAKLALEHATEWRWAVENLRTTLKAY